MSIIIQLYLLILYNVVKAEIPEELECDFSRGEGTLSDTHVSICVRRLMPTNQIKIVCPNYVEGEIDQTTVDLDLGRLRNQDLALEIQDLITKFQVNGIDYSKNEQNENDDKKYIIYPENVKEEANILINNELFLKTDIKRMKVSDIFGTRKESIVSKQIQKNKEIVMIKPPEDQLFSVKENRPLVYFCVRKKYIDKLDDNFRELIMGYRNFTAFENYNKIHVPILDGGNVDIRVGVVIVTLSYINHVEYGCSSVETTFFKNNIEYDSERGINYYKVDLMTKYNIGFFCEGTIVPLDCMSKFRRLDNNHQYKLTRSMVAFNKYTVYDEMFKKRMYIMASYNAITLSEQFRGVCSCVDANNKVTAVLELERKTDHVCNISAMLMKNIAKPVIGPWCNVTLHPGDKLTIIIPPNLDDINLTKVKRELRKKMSKEERRRKMGTSISSGEGLLTYNETTCSSCSGSYVDMSGDNDGQDHEEEGAMGQDEGVDEVLHHINNVHVGNMEQEDMGYDTGGRGIRRINVIEVAGVEEALNDYLDRVYVEGQDGENVYRINLINDMDQEYEENDYNDSDSDSLGSSLETQSENSYSSSDDFYFNTGTLFEILSRRISRKLERSKEFVKEVNYPFVTLFSPKKPSLFVNTMRYSDRLMHQMRIEEMFGGDGFSVDTTEQEKGIIKVEYKKMPISSKTGRAGVNYYWMLKYRESRDVEIVARVNVILAQVHEYTYGCETVYTGLFHPSLDSAYCKYRFNGCYKREVNHCPFEVTTASDYGISCADEEKMYPEICGSYMVDSHTNKITDVRDDIRAINFPNLPKYKVFLGTTMSDRMFEYRCSCLDRDGMEKSRLTIYNNNYPSYEFRAFFDERSSIIFLKDVPVYYPERRLNYGAHKKMEEYIDHELTNTLPEIEYITIPRKTPLNRLRLEGGLFLRISSSAPVVLERTRTIDPEFKGHLKVNSNYTYMGVRHNKPITLFEKYIDPYISQTRLFPVNLTKYFYMIEYGEEEDRLVPVKYEDIFATNVTGLMVRTRNHLGYHITDYTNLTISLPKGSILIIKKDHTQFIEMVFASGAISKPEMPREYYEGKFDIYIDDEEEDPGEGVSGFNRKNNFEEGDEMNSESSEDSMEGSYVYDLPGRGNERVSSSGHGRQSTEFGNTQGCGQAGHAGMGPHACHTGWSGEGPSTSGGSEFSTIAGQFGRIRGDRFEWEAKKINENYGRRDGKSLRIIKRKNKGEYEKEDNTTKHPKKDLRKMELWGLHSVIVYATNPWVQGCGVMDKGEDFFKPDTVKLMEKDKLVGCRVNISKDRMAGFYCPEPYKVDPPNCFETAYAVDKPHKLHTLNEVFEHYKWKNTAFRYISVSSTFKKRLRMIFRNNKSYMCYCRTITGKIVSRIEISV